MKELTMSSQQLNEIAEDLQIGISQFKLITGEKLFQRQQNHRFSSVPARLKLNQPEDNSIIDIPVRATAKKTGKSRA
jgi:hypothetical protein